MTNFEKILGEEGTERKRSRFYLNLYEGHRLFGLREFYFHKKEGEFKPTRKGINLNRDTFMELKRVLDKDEELILDWLRIGHIPDDILRYQQAQEEALKKNFRVVGDVELTEVNHFRDQHLFHVQHQGGKDIVELNISHPFAKAISEEELAKMSPGEIRDLFARIFASYARARSLLLGSGTSQPEILFEQTEFDWSEFAKEFIVEQ